MKNKISRLLHLCLLIAIVILMPLYTFSQNVGIHTLTPIGKLHVKGSENTSQLIIDADTIQSNTSPLIKLRKFDGTELMWIQADDSTNCFIGFKSGQFNLVPDGVNGVNNSFMGSRAGYSNTKGRDNTVFGTKALYSNTKGSGNTVIGTNALFMQSYDLIGSWYATNNVAIGQEALFSNQPTSTTNGVNNTAVGFRSMRQNTTGVRNVGTGMFSIYNNTLGNDNVAIGYTSLFFNTTGNFNTANGAKALFLNTTGSKNTALGYDAGVISGNLMNATAIGYNAKIDTSNALVLGGIGADAVRVGIGTQKPQATLDINGDVIFRTADITIDQSINLALDLNSNKYSSYRISIGGAEDIYSVGGIMAGMDGRLVTLFNSNPDNSIILENEDATAAPVNRIITGNGEIFILNSLGIVSLQYDTSVQRWIIKSSNQALNAGVWDMSGENIYFNEYVGIGTDQPSAPLTIQTGINEVGFSHMIDENPITLATSISDVAASIGTTSEDVFSLNAGGEGKVHIWPDGDIVIGEDSVVTGLMGAHQKRMNQFESKLTVLTPLNETGYTHIGGDNQIIVNEAIEGVSASLGTITNNTFRLKTNAIGRLHILGDGKVLISPNDYQPYGQFTVHTANNTNGIVQVGGEGQVLAMRIGGSSGSIGTWTPHVLRLISNGLGRMDIRENGQIVIGPTDAPPHGTAKFTVHTGNNTDGLVQVGGDGQVLAMRIGGSSASIGTSTPHIMRIVTNGLARINVDANGNVAIGTPDPLPGYLLSVNGNVKAKELVIETVGWPDYVFANDYRSLSLPEVEQFIKQHHHLPNIPSAKELEEGGVAVGEMQKKMMEKIEELTLYIIELNKEIQLLKESNK